MTTTTQQPYTSPQSTTTAKPVTTHELQAMRNRGEKIAMLTAYDASFAAAMDSVGVDVALIGDSLGMVLHGAKSTLAVKHADMVYHTRCVAAGVKRAMVLTDMAFGTYQVSKEQAYSNACELMAAGAHMVKIEGGAWIASTIEFLVTRGVPVCGHIGLTPQSIHTLGGYKVQGRGEAATTLLSDARALQEAGASLVLMEMVPRSLANDVTNALSVPTIGIGAGADCSGQVLVLHDLLDVFVGKRPRFAKNFMIDGRTIAQALSAYVQEVKAGTFPQLEHTFE